MAELLTMRIGAVDPSRLTADNFCFISVIRFPTRLPVGSKSRFSFSENGFTAEIALRNSQVSKGETSDGSASQNDAKTDAVLIIRPGTLPDAMFTAWNAELSIPPIRRFGSQSRLCRAMQSQSLETQWPIIWTDVSEHTALHRFFMAYHQVAYQLNRLNERYFDRSECNVFFKITAICPTGYRFSQRDFAELFNAPQKASGLTAVSMNDDESDLSNHELRKIDAAIKKQQSYLFYELATESWVRSKQGDDAIALILIATAYEGVRSAMLQLILLQTMTPNRESKDLIESFIIRAGSSSLHHVLPHLILKPSERPTAAEIKKCAAGITLRNKITHGEYQISGTFRNELFHAYWDIMRVYNKYVKAFESRLPSKQ